MKKIYYRGKAQNNNEWIYSISLLNFLTTDGEEWYMPEANAPVRVDYKKDTIGNSTAINVSSLDLLRVKEETICRYADRTDSLGNKIFEKDIVKITGKDGNTYIIVLDNITNAYIMSLISSAVYSEVIGNTIDTECYGEEGIG